MNKKKQRKLQIIPGNGKGQGMIQQPFAPPVNIIITFVNGQLQQIKGFPSDLDSALDMLSIAQRAIFDFFINNLVKEKEEEPVTEKERKFLGPRLQ